MPDQYPRMLYRLGGPKSQDVWGHQMDTLVVQSFDEERSAVKKGWQVDPNRVVKQSLRRKKLLPYWQFYLRNWQWLWGTLVAIILAVMFGS
jgi:hypothetical protein